MSPPVKPTIHRKDWYTVSVDTLRGWGIFLTLLVLAGLALVGWRLWERRALERESRSVLEDASRLVAQVQEAQGNAAFQVEFGEAWRSLEAGRGELAAGRYGEALAAGRRSRALSQSILDALRDRRLSGEAQFIAAQGGVEYRRGDRGEWEEARARLVLHSGDYVKTAANGSAEIVFLDGTLYTVRPNTLFLVTRNRSATGEPGEQSISMQYGWVNLNTSQRGSRVSTPRAEARVAQQTEAVVAYDEKSATGRFAAFRGSVDIASAGGLERRVGALQQVVQTGDLLSEPKTLPAAPQPIQPAEKLEVSIDATRNLALGWEPVSGAARYALQVGRNRLFVDNVIDVDSRAKASANLGLRGPGSFLWRVAAISRDGLQGPWSTPRTFRVVAARNPGGEGDRIPPPLEIDEVQSYGSIFIVGGRTEPGATVIVDAEQVAVAADGSFTKTVQLAKEGWSFVEIKARDVAGNETVRRRRVFVESF